MWATSKKASQVAAWQIRQLENLTYLMWFIPAKQPYCGSIGGLSVIDSDSNPQGVLESRPRLSKKRVYREAEL